jgi:hypothetical protein
LWERRKDGENACNEVVMMRKQSVLSEEHTVNAMQRCLQTVSCGASATG